MDITWHYRILLQVRIRVVVRKRPLNSKELAQTCDHGATHDLEPIASDLPANSCLRAETAM